MRDLRPGREREEIRFERKHVVWCSFVLVLGLASMFGLGYLVGKRSERLLIAQGSPPAPLQRMAEESRRHRELTFYKELPENTQNKEDSRPQEGNEEEGTSAIIASEQDQQKQPTETPTNTKAPARKALDEGPALPGDYTIQVSSFQTFDEAKSYTTALVRKGFRPYIIAAEIRNKGTWYRVRLGRFHKESMAQDGKKILLNSDIPAWVLKTE